MRASQLLAASAVCLPILGSGACGRVVSKVGEYAAQSTVSSAGVAAVETGSGGGNNTGSAAAAGGSGGSGGEPAPAGAPSIPSDDGTCTFEPLDAPRHQLDIYVMMDSNITLALGLWELAVVGLRNFANDPRSAGIGMGVKYYGTICSSSEYENPTVEIAPLPGNEPAIREASTPEKALKASQMLPAVQGAIAHQKQRALAHPEAKQVVALITDGLTADINVTCPLYDVNDVVEATRAGFSGTPSIDTYVLRLSTLADAVASDGLADVAAAGGTGTDITIGSQNVPSSVNDALQAVRRRAQPCDYEFPASTDPSRVGMATATVGSRVGEELPRVDDAGACLAQQGWYLDDAASPSRMYLCPATCSAMRTGDALAVLPLTGCKPKTR